MKYPDEFINKIVCGDNLKIMPYIPSNTIDLVVTSPPYNFGIDYEVYKDNLPWKEYFERCEKWLKEIYRILKFDGRFCLNHYISGGNSKERVAPLMILNGLATEVGFKHHACPIWSNPVVSLLTAWGSWLSASSPYINCPTEGILILYKGIWKKQTRGKSTIDKKTFMKACSGVWNIGTEKKGLTPSPFPVELPALCIKLLTYENDIVVDPFIGGGNTAIACKKLKRRYIGIDLNPRYCKIARERLSFLTIYRENS